jgi:hypothetical protein
MLAYYRCCSTNGYCCSIDGNVKGKSLRCVTSDVFNKINELEHLLVAMLVKLCYDTLSLNLDGGCCVVGFAN